MQPQYRFPEEAQYAIGTPETESDSSYVSAPRPLTESERQKATGLLKFLRRRDPVRAPVEALLLGEQPPLEVTFALFQTLEGCFGFKWRRAELAAWALGRVPLTPPQHRLAAELLERIVPLRDWPNGDERLAHGLLRTVAVSIVFCIAVFGDNLIRNPESFLNGFIVYLLSCLPLCIPLALLVFPISGIIEDIRLNRVRAAAAESLGRLGEPTSAGILAQTILQTSGLNLRQTVGCRDIGHAAVHALPAVLSNLTPEHYGQLPAHSVSRLCALLLEAQEPLALLILEALGKVGDGSAVADVRWMAYRSQVPRLREAAARILPILEQRQQMENAPKVLLRAAAAPVASADTLLRPASGGAVQADPQQLLRASNPQGN
jgi:hypothetical protein